MMQALPPNEAPAIIVTGTALPADPAERVLQSERLSRRELDRAAGQPLDRLLSRLAGAEQFRRSDSRSAHPTSQGLTIRNLGGNAASRALVLLDGVPQADPFGGWIAWPSIGALSLGEARLLRGGGSVTSGPGALAGVLELSSRTGPSTIATVEAGSRRSLEGEMLVARDVGSGSLALSLRGSRSDGFVPIVAERRGAADRPAPFRTGSARLRWTAAIGPTQELQANLATFTDQRERGLELTDNRTRGTDLSLRLVSRGQIPWAATLYAQARNFQSSFAGTDAARTAARRTSLQYDVPASAIGWSAEVRPHLGSGLEARLGIDGRRAAGMSKEYASYVGNAPTRDREAGGRQSNAGFFGELTSLSGPVTLTASARADHWRIFDGQLVERSIATGLPLVDQQFASRSGWLPTARAGTALRLDPRWSIRAAAYAGWRQPTLNELFRPFRAGSDATAANAELKPERLRGVEAGIDGRSGPWSIAATLFANRLRDAIANVTLGIGPGSFPGVGVVGAGGAYRQRQNLSAIRSRGAEVTAGWREGPWHVDAGLSLSSARVVASGSAAALDGRRPAQSPALSTNLGAGWIDGSRSLNVDFNYESARFEDDLNSLKLPRSFTVDVDGEWPLADAVNVSLRVENLLNRRVVAALAVNDVQERAMPRTVWLGLKLKPRLR
ncbi:TonB-dependent receptor [Sphingomonas piscis]|uniref:TonB-dependent receptor n=1 Tax=Sphingomonas piscis TaxID=2714943 RepID=A0A6G7YQB7_9SPHN|nr:TonB-dependent receptor [Sphingomonas piscis]QIK78931.1 TonB-dependent receptor [Sphingomonas piscis]